MQEQDFTDDENGNDSTKGSGFGGFLLFAGGFAATGLGFAFAFAPHFSWTAVKIGRQVSEAGVSNGTLIMGGFCLMGLAAVARSFRRSAAQREEFTEPKIQEVDWEALMPVLERINQEVSDLDARFTEFTQREADAEGTSEKDEKLIDALARKQNDSLFRLAASLDQLGARLVKDIQEHFTGVEDRFASLDVSLKSFREEADSATRDLEKSAPEVVEATPVDDGSLGLLDQLDDSGAPKEAPQPAQAQAQVQVQVQVAPQADPAASAPQPAFDPSTQPQALPAPAVGDTGFHPQQPQFQPQQTGFHEAPDVLAQTGFQPSQTGFHPQQQAQPQQQPPAPMPAPPAGEPHPGPSEVGIEGRSEDLESLLPDYRVREAIDDNRNGKGK